MTDELKPVRCGCGGEADVRKSPYGLWDVRCPNCCIESQFYDTEAEAVEAWNKAMGKMPVKVETVTANNGKTWKQCSRCLNEVCHRMPYCSGCGAKPNEYDDNTYECSQCGEPWTLIDGTPAENNMNFCPNCGARMERVHENL